MKKLSLYVFLVLMFCNNAYAELLLTKNIENNLLISFEEIKDNNDTILEKNYKLAARAGWFFNDNWFTFKVIVLNKINLSDKSIQQRFTLPVLYNMKFTNTSKDQFNINKGFFVMYDRESFSHPYGNYSLIPRIYEGNYGFSFNFENLSMNYFEDNKNLNFQIYEKNKLVNELEKCQEYFIKNHRNPSDFTTSKQLLNNYDNCKNTYAEMTYFLMQEGKKYAQLFLNKSNQNIADKNIEILKFDNATYAGEVKDGLPHGTGKAEYKNGNIYEGSFVNGKRTGKGILKLSSRDNTGTYDILEGEFKDGKIVKGKGTFVRGDRMLYYGKTYEGEWKDDVPHGNGKKTYIKDLHSVTGKFYEGEFKNGKEHGKGLLTAQDGTIYKVKFKNGELIDRGIFKKNKNVLE